MGYVPAALAVEGTEVQVDVRGRPLAARIVPLPFYRRPSGARKAPMVARRSKEADGQPG